MLWKKQLNILKNSLSKITSKLVTLEINSGEKSKSLSNYVKICEKVIKTNIDESDALDALINLIKANGDWRDIKEV